MSRIITNNLRHNDATADNLTLDGTGNITAPGNLSVTGTSTLTDDLVVDTDTLFVDVSTDRVGVNSSAPTQPLTVLGPGSSGGVDYVARFGNGASVAADNAVALLLGDASDHRAEIRATTVDANNGTLSLYTLGSGTRQERLRIGTDGALQLRNSPGIDFSQIQTNNAGMTSETLDGYEEGTFTPTINTGYTPTYNQQSGRYVKVGRQVAVWIYLDTLTITGSSSDTYAEVEGLPFTIRNSGILDTGFTVGWIYNLSNNVDHAYGNGNTTNIVLLGPNSSGFRTHWSPVNVWNNNDCRICLTGVYWTDS